VGTSVEYKRLLPSTVLGIGVELSASIPTVL